MSSGETKRMMSIRGRRLAADNAPACPCCGAITDDWGYSFASRILANGMFYYCNNPMCDGGQRAPSQRQKGLTQESGRSV